jgi:hypothetical protein
LRENENRFVCKSVALAVVIPFITGEALRNKNNNIDESE